MNDVNANPVEIAAVVVWRVFDAAEALFEVDDYNNYVQIQSEAALRVMATKYPYDIIEDKDIGGIALSSHQEEIANELQSSVEARLKRAGIESTRSPYQSSSIFTGNSSIYDSQTTGKCRCCSTKGNSERCCWNGRISFGATE